jgi:hypothetical protein
LEDPGIDGKVKVKFSIKQAVNAQRGSRGIALYFFLILALDGGGW